jgi:hypothetical protein
MKIIRIHSLRTFRPFHWWPKAYEGVNGVKTTLLMVGWLGIEYLPTPAKPATLDGMQKPTEAEVFVDAFVQATRTPVNPLDAALDAVEYRRKVQPPNDDYRDRDNGARRR